MENFVLQVDTREQNGKNNHFLSYFVVKGVKTIRSKMVVGDYCNFHDPKICIDRKQHLLELIGDVTKQHLRFRNELQLAKDLGIQLVVLVECCNFNSINALNYWKPKTIMYGKRKGQLESQMKGETLAKILWTMHNKYGVVFMFCKREDSGRVAYEILTGQRKVEQL